jgi:hypothetical protein
MENFLKNCGINELYNLPFFFKNNLENSVLTVTGVFKDFLSPIGCLTNNFVIS